MAATRVEQNKTAHDRAIDAKNAPPNSTDSGTHPKQGRITGFDFFRDPLNAAKPNQSPEEIMKTEIANKPKVMAAQRKLLETRYILQPKLDPDAKMQYGLSDLQKALACRHHFRRRGLFQRRAMATGLKVLNGTRSLHAPRLCGSRVSGGIRRGAIQNYG